MAADTSSGLSATHVLADVARVEPGLLRDPVRIEALMRAAAQAASARVIAAHFHHFGGGGGVTGVLLLAESHLSIHTWPELGLAAIDAFMCGAARAEVAVESLLGGLGGELRDQRVVRRGLTGR